MVDRAEVPAVRVVPVAPAWEDLGSAAPAEDRALAVPVCLLPRLRRAEALAATALIAEAAVWGV